MRTRRRTRANEELVGGQSSTSAPSDRPRSHLPYDTHYETSTSGAFKQVQGGESDKVGLSRVSALRVAEQGRERELTSFGPARAHPNHRHSQSLQTANSTRSSHGIRVRSHSLGAHDRIQDRMQWRVERRPVGVRPPCELTTLLAPPPVRPGVVHRPDRVNLPVCHHFTY